MAECTSSRRDEKGTESKDFEQPPWEDARREGGGGGRADGDRLERRGGATANRADLRTRQPPCARAAQEVPTLHGRRLDKRFKADRALDAHRGVVGDQLDLSAVVDRTNASEPH